VAVNTPTSKVCSSCEAPIPLTDFYKDDRYKSGRASRCKPCANAATKEYRHKNNESVNALRRENYKPEVAAITSRKSRYRLSDERYQQLLEAQGGVCAICKQECSTGKALAVDHDHSCCPPRKSCGDCVRALLCSRCNLGIGSFNDDINLLHAAVQYLSKGDK